MPTYTIGIDPDSEAHGAAVYVDGKLDYIGRMDSVKLMSFLFYLKEFDEIAIIVSIENVCANNFVYARNSQGSKAAQAKVGLSIGRCQQAQVELMRWLDRYGIKYVLHNPQKGNWAKNKKQFEKVTGWKGRSNEDGRSAAYFGYLALQKVKV